MDKASLRAEFEYRQVEDDARSLFGGVDWEAGGTILGMSRGDTWTDPDYQSNIGPDGRRRHRDRREGLTVETDPRAALAAFADLPPKVEKSVRNALSKKFLEPVVSSLQSRIPVNTGLMRSKITRRLARLRGNRFGLFAVVGVPDQVYFQREISASKMEALRKTESEQERKKRLSRSVITRQRAKKDKYAEGSKKAWELTAWGFRFAGYTRGRITVRGRYHQRYTLEADGTYRARVSERRRERLRKSDVFDRYYDRFADVGGKDRKKMGLAAGQSVRLRQRMPAVEMRFLEYGTRHIRPKRFVQATEQDGKIQASLEQEITAQLALTIQEVQREIEQRAKRGKR